MASEENQRLAMLYVNLRGAKKKRQDWIEIARTIRWAINHYGSVAKAAEKLGYSYELIRTIPRLLELPQDVQKLIKDGKILYDAGQRLARVPGAKRQRQLARIIVGMTSHDARQVIQYARRFPEGDLSSFKKRVSDSKGRKEQIELLVLPLPPEVFTRLRTMASSRADSVQGLVLKELERLVAADRGTP